MSQIVEKKLSELQPYEKNPRKNDEAVKYVAESIKNVSQEQNNSKKHIMKIMDKLNKIQNQTPDGENINQSYHICKNEIKNIKWAIRIICIIKFINFRFDLFII